jgi:hypothetical protein
MKLGNNKKITKKHKRGIRATLPTGIPGAYLTEGRTWDQLGARQK